MKSKIFTNSVLENIFIQFIGTENLAEISVIHKNTYPKSALILLGGKTIFLFYKYQLNFTPDSICLGAFQNNKLIGFCVGGLFTSTLSGFLQEYKKYLVLRIISHPWLIFFPIIRERILNSLHVFKTKQQCSSPKNSNLENKNQFGILSLAVNNRFQNQGIGKTLLLEMEKIAIDRGFSAIYLNVRIDNLIAIQFYENLGWNKVISSDKKWNGKIVNGRSMFTSMVGLMFTSMVGLMFTSVVGLMFTTGGRVGVYHSRIQGHVDFAFIKASFLRESWR